MMHLIPLHINCAERSGRAEVLAGTAADAFVLVYGRHLYFPVRSFIFYHLDGTCGAVACAVAAADTIGQYDAIIFDPNGMTHMDASLLFPCDRFDGTSGADLAASRAFGTAIAAFKRHRGLHEVL